MKSLFLQYELEVLDDLVLEKLNPEQVIEDITSLPECADIAQKQREKICKKMTSVTYSFSKEKYALTYIHNHQERLSKLIELLSQYQKHSSVKDSKEYQIVITQVISQISTLFAYIKENFKSYFNFEADSTPVFSKAAAFLYNEKIQEFEKKLTEPSSLLNLTFSTIKDFIKDSQNTPVTFSRLQYYELMITQIEVLIQSGKIDDQLLMKSLICLNFNSNQFMNYLIDDIEISLTGLETQKDKLDKLYLFYKIYNQTCARNDIAFEPNQGSIKEKITTWIQEEISYYELSLRIEKGLQSGDKEQMNAVLFETNLSVSQLAYSFRLLIESKLIKEKNLTQMLHFIADHSSSPNSLGKIGYSSLRKNYYNNENSTRQAVKDIIIKLLNEVNKDLVC